MYKIEIKSMIIGILTTLCLLLFMGQTKKDSLISIYNDELYNQLNKITNNQKYGRYQITSNSQTQKLYLLDTITGKIYSSIYGQDWVEEIKSLNTTIKY